MVASGSEPVLYSYDRDSRLKSVSQEIVGTTTFDYDTAGRRTRLTLPNDVSTDYDYDGKLRA